jgi:hypothetical protein
MFALIATAAAASALSPTLGDEARRIEANGVKATYTRSVSPDGTIHIKGNYEDAARTPFRYRVRGEWVEGRIGGSAVKFRIGRGD